MAFIFLSSDNIFLLISSRHWRVKDNCSNNAQPVVMEMNMRKHKFGFQRGCCTAVSCTCEGFVVMRGAHDCKTCYHTPKHHQYYNKEDYKKNNEQKQHQRLKHHHNHQPISTKKQRTTPAGKKILTMASIEILFLVVSVIIIHFLIIVVVKMKLNYYYYNISTKLLTWLRVRMH